MNIKTFITDYREAFSNSAEMPIAFWYSDKAIYEPEKTQGCFFRVLSIVRSGKTVSLNADNIGCGGGKFYAGFTPMPQHVPTFVSEKERYKQTPEMVVEFINQVDVKAAPNEFLHFTRIDSSDMPETIEGILFLATPDILSGLATWAFFDNNSPDAVSTPFGSGCCSVVTQAVNENRTSGRRTFIGFLDPSVRPMVEENLLSFTIPAFRFEEMCLTIRNSCLFGTHAWGKVRERIANQD